MKQIAFRGRLLLRKILTVLSLGAVSFVFAACYGPAPAVGIYGSVKAGDTEEPIPGILVSIKGSYDCVKTNESGFYSLNAYEQPSYYLLFEDIDGPENGEFENKEVRWFSSPLNVALDRKVNAE